MASRSTGRLIAEVDPERIEVFLMSGEIVGAVTASDERALLQRATRAGLLPEKRAGEMLAVHDTGASIFGPLLDAIPPDRVDPLLLERFRENLVRFLATSEAPSFEAMPGVFVDNMQMGHITGQLIEWGGRTADQARKYGDEVEVTSSGGLVDGSHTDAEILSAARKSITIGEIVARIDGEPWLLRAAIADLLDAGALNEVGLDLAPVAEPEPEQPDDEEEDESDAPTQAADNALLAADLAKTLDDGDEGPVPVATPEDDGFPDDPDDGGPMEQVSPGDLSQWLDSGEGLSDEDLAFFEDHEDDRGAGQGGFSTEQHNLDKVDVAVPPAGSPPPEEELLEAGEATGSKYGAPVLSDHEALEKIEVLNDVLRRISNAFDEAAGAGRGPAAIQLLVDGAPAKYTAVLHNLDIDETGEVPAEDILGNLASRPLSEQRLVLNGALKDLIGRALSTAADELPDEAFDDVYESVAGYNQRLGL